MSEFYSEKCTTRSTSYYLKHKEREDFQQHIREVNRNEGRINKIMAYQNVPLIST